MGERGKILDFPHGDEGQAEKEMSGPAAIEIGRFVSDKEGFKVLVRCELRGGEVLIYEEPSGENIAKNLREKGLDSPLGEKYFPKDGKRFFDLLKNNFRTPYLYAREKSPK